MNDGWIKLTNDAVAFFQSPAGVQVLALVLLGLLIVVTAQYAKLGFRTLDQRIADNIKLIERKSRGPNPKKIDSKIRRHEQLKKLIDEKRSLLRSAFAQFAASTLVMPFLLLGYIVWTYQIIFPHQPGLLQLQDCQCQAQLDVPTFFQLTSFLAHEILPDTIVEGALSLLGIPSISVQVAHRSILDFVLVVYKTIVPGVSAVFLFKTLPELRKALAAVPEEYKSLTKELGDQVTV